MPCYSNITTKLIELKTILKAIESIGAKIIAQSPNSIMIEKNGDHILLERYREGDNYRLISGRSSWDYDSMLEELTVSYAKITLKTWAQKSGYTFSAGKTAGEYVMTQYTGK